MPPPLERVGDRELTDPVAPCQRPQRDCGLSASLSGHVHSTNFADLIFGQSNVAVTFSGLGARVDFGASLTPSIPNVYRLCPGEQVVRTHTTGNIAGVAGQLTPIQYASEFVFEDESTRPTSTAIPPETTVAVLVARAIPELAAAIERRIYEPVKPFQSRHTNRVYTGA